MILRLFFGTAVTILIAISAPSSSGQEPMLESSPEGIRLSVTGPVTMAGNAPLPMEEMPAGEYKLSAEAPGLPAIKGRLVRSGDTFFDRPWAGPSSLFYPPGFVHLERGEKRGWIFMLSGATSGAMAIVKQAGVRNAEDKIDRAAFLNSLAITEEALLNTRLATASAVQERNDEEEVRNLWVGYFAYTRIASSLETWILTPGPRFSAQGSGQYKVEIEPASGLQSGLRSLLVPGSGQRYMGRDGRGNFFAAAVGVGAAAAIASHDAFLEARRQQSDVQRRFLSAESEEEIEALRNQLREAANNTEDKNLVRWTVVGITGGLYLWNVVDAFALGNQARSEGMNWAFSPTPDGFLASVTWRLQ